MLVPSPPFPLQLLSLAQILLLPMEVYKKNPYLETYFEIVCGIVFSHILFIGPMMILVLINLVSDGSKQEFYMDFSFCKAPSYKLYIMLY